MLAAILLFATFADAPKPLEPSKLDRKEPIDYAKDIAPFVQKKCTYCHSGWVAKGGYHTSSYSGLLRGGKRGAAVKPGKSDESLLYLLASHRKEPTMPPESEPADLTATELALLKRWIEEGAKGPNVAEAKMRPAVVLTLPAEIVKPVRALAMHPSKAILAVARGNRVCLLDARSGEMIAPFVDDTLKTADGKPANVAHVSIVESLAFSPDGKTLATGSFREVKLWDAEKRQITNRLAGFADKVMALDWSPDGAWLATAGGAPTEDGEIRLFDSTGILSRDLKSPHSDTVFGIAFSPDGKTLASAGADKFVRTFSMPDGKLLKSFEGHTQHALDVAWSPNGKRIISAGADDLIKLWNFETGERVRDLRGTRRQSTRLAFAAKSPLFYSTGGDGVVRRWNVESGDPSRTFTDARDFLYALAVSPDGTLLASGGEEGIVRLYDGKTNQMLKAVAPK